MLLLPSEGLLLDSTKKTYSGSQQEKRYTSLSCVWVGHSQQNKGTQQIQADLGAVAIFIEKKRQENRQHRKSK